jgi:hypothetical protein
VGGNKDTSADMDNVDTAMQDQGINPEDLSEQEKKNLAKKMDKPT